MICEPARQLPDPLSFCLAFPGTEKEPQSPAEIEATGSANAQEETNTNYYGWCCTTDNHYNHHCH